LQECIIPELTVYIQHQQIINARLVSHKWLGLRCNIETENTPDGYLIDIRTKYNDDTTSVVLSSGQTVSENKGSLMVDDSAVDSAAFLVLTNEQGKIIDKKNTTIGN